MALHSKPSAARLNALLVRRGILSAQLILGEPRLVMLPFERRDDGLWSRQAGVQVPLLLLEGGPQLDALRASVHKIKTAVSADS